MSSCCTAISAAIREVRPPIHAIASIAHVPLIRKNTRHSMYTPAATIVAAWMSALTGVGPSIASGSHTCSGAWADFPIAPQKIRNPAKPVMAAVPVMSLFSMASKLTEPIAAQTIRMPIRKPKSPTRLVRKAFLAASAALGFSNQKPINR